MRAKIKIVLKNRTLPISCMISIGRLRIPMALLGGGAEEAVAVTSLVTELELLVSAPRYRHYKPFIVSS